MEGAGWSCRFVLLTVCDVVVVEIIRGVGTGILVCGTVSGGTSTRLFCCVLGYCEAIL